jgi:hypothetical protein
MAMDEGVKPDKDMLPGDEKLSPGSDGTYYCRLKPPLDSDLSLPVLSYKTVVIAMVSLSAHAMA